MKYLLSEVRVLINEAIRKAYEILSVPMDASQDEIKAAHRRALLKFHPDRNLGKDTTHDMAMANIAAGILLDPNKRSRYNQ